LIIAELYHAAIATFHRHTSQRARCALGAIHPALIAWIERTINNAVAKEPASAKLKRALPRAASVTP
jgi:hypothetical protein